MREKERTTRKEKEREKRQGRNTEKETERESNIDTRYAGASPQLPDLKRGGLTTWARREREKERETEGERETHAETARLCLRRKRRGETERADGRVFEFGPQASQSQSGDCP